MASVALTADTFEPTVEDPASQFPTASSGIVLVNFWASWCGPCREEMPLLDAFEAKQSSNGTRVIRVALDTAEHASRFVSGQARPFPTLLEPPGPSDSSVRLGNRQGVLPFTVLIDARGRLVKRRFGPFTDEADLGRWAESE